MKHVCRAVLLGFPGMALLAYAVWPCGPSEVGRRTARAADLPPLVLDLDRAPRLDKPPADADRAPKGPMADNSACYVCHVNYQDEQLAQDHAKEEVGCVDCHGKSMKHQEDEFHETPPDRMYALGSIDSMCGKCHDEHDVTASKVLRRWQERCPEKTDPRSIVCTDCHGHHRLERRSVRWDKETGKLLQKEVAGEPSP